MEDGLMTNISTMPNPCSESNSHTLMGGGKHYWYTRNKIKQGVQIIHTRGSHWIVASTLESSKCEIKIFDSLYTSVHKDTQNIILSLLETNGKPRITMAEMSKQEGMNDCGVFAIAAATALAFGLAPVQLQKSGMRGHLLKCFEDGAMTPFPTA